MSEGGQSSDLHHKPGYLAAHPEAREPGDPAPSETVVVEAPPMVANPDRQNETDDVFKTSFRDHARWAMIEMQLCAAGKNMDERAALNP